MTREELSEMIARQMAELVAQKVADKLIALQKKALVVFTGALIGFNESLESLKKLKGEGFTYSVFLSQSAASILDISAIREALQPENLWIGTTEQAPEALAAVYHTILVPALTVNTASHIAASMPDTPASRIISNAMWRGKNVVLSIDGCCPDHPFRGEKYRLTEPLKAQWRANLEAIQSFGGTLTSSEGLYRKTMKVIGASVAAPAPAPKAEAAGGSCCVAPASAAVAASGKVIGRGQVMNCPAGGTLRVPKGSVVTALARDTARSRGVTIIQE